MGFSLHQRVSRRASEPGSKSACWLALPSMVVDNQGGLWGGGDSPSLGGRWVTKSELGTSAHHCGVLDLRRVLEACSEKEGSPSVWLCRPGAPTEERRAGVLAWGKDTWQAFGRQNKGPQPSASHLPFQVSSPPATVPILETCTP